jgi:hypothetical protein
MLELYVYAPRCPTSTSILLYQLFSDESNITLVRIEFWLGMYCGELQDPEFQGPELNPQQHKKSS